jgi:flagellar FliL protein
MLPLFNAEGAEPPLPEPGQVPPQAAPATQNKVELDLEGAPFLEAEPPPAPAPSPVQQSGAPQEAPAPKKSKKKLLLIFGLAGFVFLGGISTAAYFLFFRSSTVADAPPGVEVVVIPSTAPPLPAAPTSQYNLMWPPFWVEVQDPEGEARLVYCKLTLPTNNAHIFMQLNAKNIILRDAVYYYLRHKPYAELADLRRLDKMKVEILNVINYYILPEQAPPPAAPADAGQEPARPQPSAPAAPAAYEKLTEILIDDYMIR